MTPKIPASALQVASIALAPYLPIYGDPQRLLDALERDLPGVRSLTPVQVADRVGVSSRTILDWIRAGKLPARKYGKRTIRILEPDLNAFLAASPRE